ncbi:hypothetical protein KDW_50530 [Dictyobacter vulcani]|uniref:Transposase IS4-like domain-containing protein n=1 Tax=Dictyobacter vulcani TaxID=2607529 RepID=A0A5J4KWP2_9CHLR|nr:hypothetical protein [Dictyobacter vulcani]GER90891.1 hypothetical protein KDW_50530 [Dictyobacter vulcani]
MSSQYLTRLEEPQVPPYPPDKMAQGLYGSLAQFLAPLLIEVDTRIDKRLVRTLLQTVVVILTFRDRVNGLLLSEMGGYLDTPDKAPAGTKRLSRLLHCSKWSAELIRSYLWHRATQRLATWKQAGMDALALWDESAWEKPESIASDDLGPVRSSKAARLTHVKKGYYTPPRGPIFVPGLHWLAVVLVGCDQSADPPALACMRWWTSRGARASFKRDEQAKLLLQGVLLWGREVMHVFDQGFASSFWLGLLVAFSLRFVLRWKKDYQLVDEQGQRRAAWKIARGKRGWQQRLVWDCRRHQWVMASILALPVTHPDHREQPLWVVARRKGGLPWYLLTAEPIANADDAWRIMFAYARRWQIELTWKENKSELAFQSPRVWEWEPREKLLLLAALAYAFLLTLLAPFYTLLRRWLLRRYCHRTGRHCRQAHAPFARMRMALSRLWQSVPPHWESLSGRGQPTVSVTML